MSSLCETEFPICALKRARSEARRHPSSKRSTKLLTDQCYSAKQVEEALLPDGTVFHLTTTWNKQVEGQVKYAKATQVKDRILKEEDPKEEDPCEEDPKEEDPWASAGLSKFLATVANETKILLATDKINKPHVAKRK